MSPAEAWLRDRLAAAPPRLLDAMIAAVSTEDASGPSRSPGLSVSAADEVSVADALAAGALALYARVLRGTGGREDALPLLAADALMTHALEAQAEVDPDGIAAFAERWGAAGRLAELAPAG